jgi:hypothetical protein
MGSVSPVQFRILMELVSSGEAFTNGESGLSGRCLPDRRLFVVFFCRRAKAVLSLCFLEVPSQSGFLGLCYEYGKILPYLLVAAALASSRTAFPVSESPVRLYLAEGNYGAKNEKRGPEKQPRKYLERNGYVTSTPWVQVTSTLSM